MEKEKELTELYARQMHQVEELARRLMQAKFESAQHLWDIEIELANYQVALQKEIKNERVAAQEIKAKIARIATERQDRWKERIVKLQEELTGSESRISVFEHAHVASRQLGSALAWALLDLDEQKIIPLTENLPVRSTSSGLSLTGMLKVAELYNSVGAGFPIIHDITGCLRVGDITFVKPDDEPITVEVKTRVLRREGNVAHLRVETYAPLGADRWKPIQDKLQNQFLELTEPQPDFQKPRRKPDKQLLRQLERMSRARVFQVAKPGKLIEDANERIGLAVRLDADHKLYHWDLLRELLACAKKNGYASQVVDGAFVYVAIYTDPPTVYPWVQKGEKVPFEETLKLDLDANFPRCADLEKNISWFGTSWDHFIGKTPPYIRPLFLYPLPFDIVADMLWGRFAIMVFVNLCKLAEAVEAQGFVTRMPKDKQEFRQILFSVSTQINLPNGYAAEIHLGSLYRFGARVVYEFLSLQGFVSLVSQMANAMIDATKVKWEEQSRKDSL
jgi:hypothetical protein